MRQWVGTPIGRFHPNTFVSFLAGSHRAQGSDCSTSKQAYGKWELAGSTAGFFVCYTDAATGDAYLYWTYDQPSMLVRAINQHGESSAVDGFFDKYAKFINP